MLNEKEKRASVGIAGMLCILYAIIRAGLELGRATGGDSIDPLCTVTVCFLVAVGTFLIWLRL